MPSTSNAGRRLRRLLACLLAAALAFGALADTRIERHVIAGGGGSSSGTDHVLNGTIGQPVVGASSDSRHAAGAGFWDRTGSHAIVFANGFEQRGQ